MLELACGTGIVTRRLREALPDSAVLVATDLNEPMLLYARAAVPAPGITWQQADAQALAFDDASDQEAQERFGLFGLAAGERVLELVGDGREGGRVEVGLVVDAKLACEGGFLVA